MTSVDVEPVATRHYFDREFAIPAVKLLPGEYYVTTRDMILTTVLGSCVSACVRDSTAGIGGMNHFMLPENADPASHDAVAAMRYGIHAMEMLLSELLKAGARRERLEAKVFGGGAVLANMTMLNVGDRNADFVLRYLQGEQVRIAAQDLRGSLPRRINYFPASGRVAVRKLRRQDDVVVVQHDEQALVQALLKQTNSIPLKLLETGAPSNKPNKSTRPP
ncbi:chemoreceptor glutamine deamidase CheD [Rhodoferax sp.]|jgi:chemotaxis protein CheD|uniref:chemoreceptor glutamine deamidase CheD n=1 Tax=Rhodoferax sp. TaxID=50421 RepID=UPI002731BD73|nr:chemoreceptor glutamine deamidase CheD [Rhodoferax sp.]MDP1530389.1 chemoreceptor glutamine deamidase CheD [Rhodoferax sp.]MDP1943265.1 chemoreceptor glutamine deamidase CheD [Rhodoferax sp.]MDP2442691.1 chemoreceptor glutamine deamidase CheD [Rhodoferax sp.]MDP3191983.1 chemoreceptor glutamine deamidase CheD [Rhodoferax sp.]MDP3337244.1 chemoreceptor glutamine deamidase CheD [Rhodoferax sp.]